MTLSNSDVAVHVYACNSAMVQQQQQTERFLMVFLSECFVNEITYICNAVNIYVYAFFSAGRRNCTYICVLGVD